MELATLKVERFCVGAHQAVSQSTCTKTVKHVLEAAASVIPLSPFGQDSKSIPVWGAGSVGQPATAAAATTTLNTLHS